MVLTAWHENTIRVQEVGKQEMDVEKDVRSQEAGSLHKPWALPHRRCLPPAKLAFCLSLLATPDPPFRISDISQTLSFHPVTIRISTIDCQLVKTGG